MYNLPVSSELKHQFNLKLQVSEVSTVNDSKSLAMKVVQMRLPGYLTTVF